MTDLFCSPFGGGFCWVGDPALRAPLPEHESLESKFTKLATQLLPLSCAKVVKRLRDMTPVQRKEEFDIVG